MNLRGRNMSKIRYLIYGSIVVGIFVILHLIFPRTLSNWLQWTDQLFSGTNPGHLALFIPGVAVFIIFVFLYGINFFASFGKPKYPDGSENFQPDISVIIPAKDEEKIIGETLESYVKSKYPKDKLELIVVASDSTDKTVEICQSYQDRLTLKILTEPLPKKGKPAALNLGLKHASHELLCIFDADTQVQENSLLYLVRHLYNPDISAVQGPIQVRNWNINKLTKALTLDFAYFITGAGLYADIRNHLGRTLWIVGRNYCIRKKVMEEIGGWNEDSLAEDMHLTVQLAMLKKQVRYAPDALCSETVPTDFESFKHQRQRWVAGYSQGMDAVMKLDVRTVLLRNFGMLHYGHMGNYALAFLVATFLVGFIAKDLYVTLLCIITCIFIFGQFVNALRKYGNGRYRVLLYYPIYFVCIFYMFYVQFTKKEGLEWDKTQK